MDRLQGEFRNGYIECALWAGVDVEGEPESVSNPENDLSSQAYDEMDGDIEDFWNANRNDLDIYCEAFSPAYAGHDFFLTRNGHGAGFWDRAYAPGTLYDACKRLSEASKVYGSQDLYVGDDELIYVQ